VVILLMAIGGYSINGYWWMGILLMAICGYSINGYWLLNYK
jgi:hypothetical protein